MVCVVWKKGEINMATNKISASMADGVEYRRAKLWQIILVAANGLNGMAVYSLIGMASYSASIGYGIATAIIAGLLTFTRIFDAITDPLLAFLYDRMNTRWGKVRPLMLLGWAVQSLGLFFMFTAFSSKGHGVPTFLLCYMLYVIGYTIVNMTAQTLPALMTNDPKQRPMVGVWFTLFNYMVPMILTIVLNVVMLPRFGGTYNQAFLSAATFLVIFVSLVGVILVCIGVSAYDKPEFFEGTKKGDQRLKVKDMISVLKSNRPLQCYIASAASDKIAQQAQSASVVTTMLLGILIGNMGLGTILSVIGMLPSIIFAFIGAKYAGKHGHKESIVRWTTLSLIANAVMILFFIVIEPSSIAHMGITMILFVLLTLVCNGFAMGITTSNTGFMADIIDYELDRSGKYIPAVITGTYSLVAKIVSSFSGAIATGCVAIIGYTATLPQPGDEATAGVFWMTMFLRYGLAIIGWLVTLLAMRFCGLDRKEMIEVQKRISEKKAELKG